MKGVNGLLSLKVVPSLNVYNIIREIKFDDLHSVVVFSN